MTDTETEKPCLIDIEVCRVRCQHFSMVYNASCGHTGFCSLKKSTVNTIRAFTACPFFVEHLLVGGQNFMEVTSFPVTELVGCTIIFRKQEGACNICWEGKVKSLNPGGIEIDRFNLDGSQRRSRTDAFLTTNVLTAHWPSFRLKRTDDSPEELVRFVCG